MESSLQPKQTAGAEQPNRRTGRRVGIASASGVVTILAVSVIVVVATGFTPARARLLDGGAWLADAENMPHASGPNAAVDAAVQKCPTVDDCRWVQRDGLAYLLQARSGQVHRLDTATRAFDEQGVSIGSPESRLLVGTGRVYSIDKNQGTVTSRDPVSLAPRGDAVRLTGGAGDALVDRAGVLWAIENGTGHLVGVDDTATRFSIPIAGSGADLGLGSIDDTPVVLDQAQGVVVPIDDQGNRRGAVKLRGFDPRRLVLGRDLPAGPLFFIEKGSGRIGKIALGTGEAEDVAQLGVGDTVGALYVVGRNLFVPQPDARVVRWFSTDTNTEREPLGEATEVFVKDGYLFINDANAREAYVAGPDTDPQKILKRRDDIPKLEVKPEQNSYDPTPVSVTTTTRPGEGEPEPPDQASTTSSSSSSTTSTTTPGSSTTLPAADVPPSAPTNVQGDGRDAEATVRWNWSQASIDHFEIEPAADSPASFGKQNAPASSCGGGDCSIVIKNLSNGSTYKFVLFAVDAKGLRSPASAPSNPTPVDAGLPGSPGSISLKGRPNGTIQVSWAAASQGSGGRAITEYTVTALDGSKQPTSIQTTSNGTSAELKGLDNGRPYHVRVVAKNDAGKTGTPAESQQSATPFGPPTAVTPTTSADPTCGATQDGRFSWPVGWSGYPFEADSAVRQYRVKLNGLGETTTPSNSTSLEIASGRQAKFEVAAENDAGIGPFTTSGTVTCYLQDPANLLRFNLDATQAGSVTVSLQNPSSPAGGEAATAGSSCCFVRLSDANFRVTGTTSGASSVAPIPIGRTQFTPGDQSSAATIATAGLNAGDYQVTLQSPSGALASTGFTVAGTTTTTAAAINDATPYHPGTRSLVASVGAIAVKPDAVESEVLDPEVLDPGALATYASAALARTPNGPASFDHLVLRREEP